VLEMDDTPSHVKGRNSPTVPNEKINTNSSLHKYLLEKSIKSPNDFKEQKVPVID
jgi:hypothetical protein